MDASSLRALIEDVAAGRCAPDDAVRQLRRLPYSDLGFARVDHHRDLRLGIPEAVYGPGKTPEHCAAVVGELLTATEGPVLLTRAGEAQVKEGQALYAQTCRTCHGEDAKGGVKDLRFMTPETHKSFADIVLGGVRADKGMASFKDLLTPSQAEAIHAYLIARANEDWQDEIAK